jgi:rhomboid protease GluP
MSSFRSAPGSALLVVLLIAIFVAEVVFGLDDNPRRLLRYGAIPSSGRFHGEYWRLLSYSLLHLNTTHLVANVALLAWVGRIVERRVGTGPFFLVSIVSVLVAGLAIAFKDVLDPTYGVSVGASGGVFGLLSASIVLVFRRDMAGYGQDRGVQGGLLVCLGLAIAMSFLPGVSFAGHLGGLVAGTVLGLVVPGRATGVPGRRAPAGGQA